jgi:hypothetical protein
MNCPLVDPHWTAYVSAIGTPIIAVIAAGMGGLIAYRQWRTAQDRLKLDLFDRRLAIYGALMRFLNSVQIEGRVDDARLFTFLGDTRNAKWLLSQENDAYFDEIRQKADEDSDIHIQLRTLPDGEERTRQGHASSAIILWMLDQFKAANPKFAPFLTLRH